MAAYSTLASGSTSKFDHSNGNLLFISSGITPDPRLYFKKSVDASIGHIFLIQSC